MRGCSYILCNIHISTLRAELFAELVSAIYLFRVVLLMIVFVFVVSEAQETALMTGGFNGYEGARLVSATMMIMTLIQIMMKQLMVIITIITIITIIASITRSSAELLDSSCVLPSLPWWEGTNRTGRYQYINISNNWTSLEFKIYR